MKKLIKDILTSKVIPTSIYKGICGDNFTIEIEERGSYTSYLYKTELERDNDFKKLDNEVFDKLTFNPYKRDIIE